jgi:signal transduction histidine kinase
MRKISILWKLILAFLLVAITAAAIVAFFIRLTSVDRLTDLIIDQQRSSLESSLAAYYAANGSWQGIEDRWREVLAQPSPAEVTQIVKAQAGDEGGGRRDDFPPPFQTRPGDRDRRSLFGLADAQGRVLIPIDTGPPAGTLLPENEIRSGTAVMVDGKRVGTILTARLSPRFNPEETLFLQRTNLALLYAAAAAMLVALVIGVILARTLIRPLQALTQAAQNIARGDLEQQVPVRAKDEIGQLAEAFNRMSLTVARSNQQRKQMTADIAHDLRTPLTVIAGYVESMRDGVLKPTPDRLDLIYTEIEHLQNLVGDLKLLSQAEAGELPMHPAPVDPCDLLERAAAPFDHSAEQQKVTLVIQVETGLPPITVDEGRMMQVFGNLISNALRYTPPGGAITLSAERDGGAVRLAVADTGSGISPEELPYIFDRFHRADKSRHAESGESGLGLAIVKALIEAHGGTVSAVSTPDKGTRIEMLLNP